MKRYANIFGTKGIATIFAENFADEFTNIFGENTAANVDNYIVHKYGYKPLCTQITAENAVATICAIIQLHLQTWQKIHGALSLQYNAVQSVNETKTKRGSITRENENTDTDTDAQKAFNDTNFVTDTQNTSHGLQNGVEMYDLTETRTEINGNAAMQLDAEIKLRNRYNLQQQVIETIINEICLTIY